MNLKSLHHPTKLVSTSSIFKPSEGHIIALQIKKDALLKEHVSNVSALLLCVEGCATYNDEHDTQIEVNPGDYVLISPEVKHWVTGIEESQLILIK